MTKTSITKQRIKRVFNKTTENIQKGKAPNVKREMLKAGYSKSSANAQTITRTKTWQELLIKYDDEPIMDAIYKDALSKEDKRNATDNRKLYLKVKGHLKDDVRVQQVNSDQKQFWDEISSTVEKTKEN